MIKDLKDMGKNSLNYKKIAEVGVPENSFEPTTYALSIANMGV